MACIVLFAEISRVAKDLKNCAASYSESVQSRSLVIIALNRTDVGGHEKPFALAEYRTKKPFGWGQIVESCNESASPKTRAYFEAMDESLEVWAAAAARSVEAMMVDSD
jgi:hypothetical protein